MIRDYEHRYDWGILREVGRGGRFRKVVDIQKIIIVLVGDMSD